MLGIINRPGSNAASKIVSSTSLRRCSKECDVLVNYGLSGNAFDIFCAKRPYVTRKPIINRVIGASKYKVIKDVERLKIDVPTSKLTLTAGDRLEDYIIKRFHSQCGIGIGPAKTRDQRTNTYYQKFIRDRRYELRVHGFLWMNTEDWVIQKRLGESNTIAWNYHNGGRFQSIHNSKSSQVFIQARLVAEKVLTNQNMAFGAVDFIVTKDGKLIFLEVNSAPGFTEFSEGIYINAFTELAKIKPVNLMRYC